MKSFWPRKLNLKWLKRSTTGACLLSLSLIFLSFKPSVAFSDVSPKAKKAVIILVNNVTWDDIKRARLPFVERLSEEATLALFSPRTATTNATAYRGYTTLSAGSRAQANRQAALGFNRDETWENRPVTDWYQSLTGLKPRGEVLHIGVTGLEKRNEDVNYDVFPGALGEELKKGRLKTAVLGNADEFKNTFEGVHREAALIAMDRRGSVDFGDVGKQMIEFKNGASFGVQTDYSHLTSKFWQVYKKANLIVVETGDTYRADLFSPLISENLHNKYKGQALRRVDKFLAEIIPALGKENTLVVMVAPSPPKALRQKDVLTPVILWGKEFKGGLATSATTRRLGLITNVDLAPTVLEHFSIKPPSHFLGRKIVSRSYKGSDRLDFLTNFSLRSITNDTLQPLMIISYIVFAMAVFLFAFFYMLIGKPKKNYVISLISGALLGVLALPLSYFLLPLVVPVGSKGGMFMASFFLTVLLALGALQFRRSLYGPVSFLVAATTILIGADLTTGSNLNINTIFGYSPIVGGRFYGLGNQALAIFFAAGLLSSVFWIEWRAKLDWIGKITIISFFLLIVMFVGFPRWGADVGGTVTTIVAFAATYFNLLRKKISGKYILLTVLAVILVLTVFAAIDVFQGKNQETHLGRTVELVKAEGNSAALQVIQRKFATNLRILKYSSWSYFFIIILALLLYLRFRPIGLFQKLLDRHVYLGAGITGAFVGGIVGFLTNDSGIVIPALILSYFMAAIFYLMIQEQGKQGQN